MAMPYKILLLSVSSTSACTILNNNNLNIIKFSVHAVSCSYVVYVWCSPLRHPTVSHLGGVPFKAPQKTKTEVIISQPLWCPLPDSSLSQQCTESIVRRKETVQNSYPLRTQYTGNSLHLIPELQCLCFVHNIEKYSWNARVSSIIMKILPLGA
jgi:hypothetical protein